MTGSRNPYQKTESGISRRALRGLLLTLLLPPVGLVYLWRGGVFRLRGRILVTALACIEMTILLSTGLFGLIQWDRRPATQTPVPGNAAAVTAYPGDDTVNALSNIDHAESIGPGDPGSRRNAHAGAHGRGGAPGHPQYRGLFRPSRCAVLSPQQGLRQSVQRPGIDRGGSHCGGPGRLPQLRSAGAPIMKSDFQSLFPWPRSRGKFLVFCTRIVIFAALTCSCVCSIMNREWIYIS